VNSKLIETGFNREYCIVMRYKENHLVYREQVKGIRLNAKLFTYNQIEQTFLLIPKILLFKIFRMIIDIELVMVEIIVMTTDTISFKLCDERNHKKGNHYEVSLSALLMFLLVSFLRFL
jgi:hypothetical protein